VLSTSTDSLKRRLAHKIVVIGGAWHQHAYARGDQIDSYETPVGKIGGVFIHGNYVEALLDLRTYTPIREEIVIAVEVGLVLLIGIFFALELSFWWKTAAGGFSVFLLMFTSYAFLQNLGLFFDFLVPLLLVSGHFALDQILEWRRLARSYQSEKRRA